MRRFVVPLIVVLAVGVILILIQWYKPHRRAEDATGIPVTALALFNAYKSNEQAANRQYLNKVIAVSGELQAQEKNQDGQTVAVLRAEQSDDLLAGGVMCTLRDKEAKLPAGAKLTLKGFCTGFANDVHLTDCIVSNP